MPTPTPLERLSARVESIITRAESGQPIDWQQERIVVDIFVMASGVHYAQQAIDRSNAADAAHLATQSAADEDMIRDQ